jgi:cyclophilin family peptidyl-prolyl cis-trans isomerase
MIRSNNRKRSLRKKSNAGLSFGRLEPRKMLAGDLPTGTNLIVNGDFETFTNDETLNVVNSFATARFYGSDLVPNWTVADGDGDDTQRINLLTFDNSRGTVLDVDSIPGQDDRVFQNVNVNVGQEYLFSFDFLGPDQVAGVIEPATNDFDVFYNGELLGTLQGTNSFQQASFLVTGAANDPAGSTDVGDLVSARFEFRDGSAGNREGDGRGSLIDAVSLVAVTESTVVNAGFENNDAADGPDFPPEDVDGFSVFSFASDTEDRVIRILSDDTGADSNNFLNLNSSPDLIDRVFQDLTTEAGQSYIVTFDARVDPTSTSSPDQLRVRFDNQFAANIIGNDQWQSYSVLVEASSSSSRLTFREPGGDSGDGASPQIDNLRFFQINETTSPINDLVVDANGSADGLNAGAMFEENGAPQNIASATVISHDSGETLNFALIALVGGSILPTESLAVDVGSTGVTAVYDSQTGELRLRGRATIATYQQIIRSLTYDNTSENPLDRIVGISVTNSNIVDDTNFSRRTLVNIEANATNDAPTLAAIGDQSLGFGQSLSLTLDASDVDDDDATLSYEVVEAGALTGQLSVSSTGVLTLPVAAQAGNFDVTVAVSDPEGATAERTFAIDVADFVPFEGIGALSNVPTALRNDIYTTPPPQNIDTALTYDAVLDTSQGEIRIRLLDDESPTFVNNFVNLARDGFYDGLTFHRVIDGFVGQGGDPLGTGRGGPGYEIPDEVGNDIDFDSRGQLSFANAGNNTTGSQFFITFEPTNLNNGQFSVFGNVTSGDAVLDLLTRTENFGVPIPGVVPDVINSIRIEEV